MSIPRLLVVFLLVALCVAPLRAQSAKESNPAFSQFESASQLQEQSWPGTMPDSARPGEDEFNLTPRLQRHAHRSSLSGEPALAENESTCYFLRSYRVTRDDPDSDSTRPAGYSTCLPGTRIQMKSAVDSQELAPR
jgi:hypothetical protein